MLLRDATVRDLDRLTARVVESAGRTSGCRLDAYRDGGTFYIDIDLPGVDPADIDIVIDRKVLTVRASRHNLEHEGVSDAAGSGDVEGEWPMGAFSRQVFLSDTLDTDRLEARYENDVLTLRIPVVESTQARAAAAGTPAGA